MRQFPRFHGVSSSPSPRPRTGYPERLLIYHAGTAKTVFIGCLKVTTIFLFAFSSLVVAPKLFFAEEPARELAVAAFIGGAIPILFVTYTTSPFVSYIHLRLPHYARRSHEMLLRYAKTLPAEAKLEMSTMRFTGQPRINAVKAHELLEESGRFGVANYRRRANDEGSWGRAKRFYVAANAGSARVSGVWEDVRRCIRKYPLANKRS
ncbi:MAG: hypothetical protein M1829_002810 [Trizodia sp. TS-e1964]|nr:MAG: hypothetical protein M1829_002810 [Trizodia sp. TS-e1964]